MSGEHLNVTEKWERELVKQNDFAIWLATALLNI